MNKLSSTNSMEPTMNERSPFSMLHRNGKNQHNILEFGRENEVQYFSRQPFTLRQTTWGSNSQDGLKGNQARSVTQENEYKKHEE